jgi:nitrogenase molybdenum-iron protein alpha/beta subunit
MRSEAMDAAETMRERFGQPYVFGRPYGIKATADFLQAVSQTAGADTDKDKLADELEKCREVLFDFAMRLRNQKTAAVVSGNYDLVRGMCGFLKEAGFHDVLGIVNHKLKGGKYAGGSALQNMTINPPEDEIPGILSDFKPDVVLGDAVLLELSKNIEKAGRYQMSNPNTGSFRFYGGTPFIGFNGVIYLCEALCNIVKIENRSAH